MILGPAIYLTYTFFHLFTCPQGMLGCGLQDFAPIFPFYLIIATFVSRLNIFEFFLLYILSSVAYLGIFYYFGLWLEDLYVRYKHRPSFSLKKIVMH